MSTLYTLSIFLYGLGIRIASVFNLKARKWVEGRRGLFRKLDERLKHEEGRWKGNVWFHCASLGEFEQGRPVIEGFRELYPEYRIILTFYSPSGYEVRSTYAGAEGIFYMPLDTPANARKWVSRLKPKLVFFIKYEYWFNFLKELDRRHIPVFIISAVFHRNQPFFKKHARWFRKQLKHVSWFFLQSEEAKELAESLEVKNFTIAGDTRFDRVWSISEQKHQFPVIEKFAGNAQLFLGGSTWEPDEALIISLINQNHPDVKFIIAPHEAHETRIRKLEETLIAQGTEHRAQGTEHRAQGTEHRAQGTEHRVQGTEHRAQGTEHRAQGTDHRVQDQEIKTADPVSLIPDPVSLIPDPVSRIPDPVSRIPDPVSRIPDHASAVIRYSRLTPETATSARVIIIDSIGILAHLYQYASFSMIGGGFGVGIHNILEAAAFGNPVMFGPNYQKFSEARELIRLGGAFSVKDAAEFSVVMKSLLENSDDYQRVSAVCRNYVTNNRGATRRILQGIQSLGFIASPR